MTTTPPPAQPEENNAHTHPLFTRAVRMHRPSLLKDPTTLFSEKVSSEQSSVYALLKPPFIAAQHMQASEPIACASSFPDSDVSVIPSFDVEEVPADQQLTWLIPAVATLERLKKMPSIISEDGNPMALLSKLIKDSGIYAIASCLSPLLSLFVSPFLAHHLTYMDYGMLILLNTTIALLAGLSQCGLGSAFVQIYHRVDTSRETQRRVLTTVCLLMFMLSCACLLIIACAASEIARWLLHNSAYASVVRIAASVLFIQNFVVPTLALLRAERRANLFCLLSVLNLLVAAGLTYVLVGILQWGSSGALLAVGGGSLCVGICQLPIIWRRARFCLDWKIIKELFVFGLSTVPGFLAVWILQLSDRYFLSWLGFLSQTAGYGVAYTLGNVLGPLVIMPFSLAWYSTMYGIARRTNASTIFCFVFRWYCLALLFCAFFVALFANDVLTWMFPPAYASAEMIIPFIALANVFYGLFELFMVGVLLREKVRFTILFLPLAAVVHIALNCLLIPNYGIVGAAISTLVAYLLLACVAYFVNQRIYPLPFEIGLFGLALCLGIVWYIGAMLLLRGQSVVMHWIILGGIGCLYGGILFLLGHIPAKK
ncbi:lipopolysaccharide biosynthesis protein [Dictyobacter arantiisoli]|nr:polysaccharide biosynthesis C-terminal domain-containing protein [Dictyobacter arantiisoli]